MVASSWQLETRTRRHRGGPGDKNVGSEVASLWRPSLQLTSEGQLVSRGWLASGGPLEGHWCCVCREVSASVISKQVPELDTQCRD